MSSTLIGKQAIVIGAGMGGLTAAGRSPTASIRWLFWSATLCPRSQRLAPGRRRRGTCMRCCSAASAPLASCSQGSSRISRGREPCRSGPVSMFAWSARATILSRNAISAGSVTRCHGRQSSAPARWPPSFLTCWRACRPPSASPALPAASASVRFVGIVQMMKAGPNGRLP
jgi:hypothetical protein